MNFRQKTIIIPKGLPVAIQKSQRNIHFAKRTPWDLCLVNKHKEKSYICQVNTLLKKDNYARCKLRLRVVPSSGFIASIISCKLLSYLVINSVD